MKHRKRKPTQTEKEGIQVLIKLLRNMEIVQEKTEHFSAGLLSNI